MSLAPMHLPDLGDIHDQYLALVRERGDRGGSLLLRVGFDLEGISALIAAGLAGAAALCVDSEPELLREGLRHGLCDFLVADLSEALRILKNEIRQRRAASVCLAGEPESLIHEMAERGVQPELVSWSPEASLLAAGVFRERGAAPVPAAQADPTTERVVWSVESDAARILPQVAHIAAAALDEQRGDTPARRHWLANAPRWLGRSWGGRQCVRMTSGESEIFTRQACVEFPGIAIARNRSGT